MKQRRLKADFDWQICKSDSEDLKSMGCLLASRILFNIFLINHFENAVLSLKNQDCVWGPVHSSVGQEAVAAASIAALRKEDKISGSHRAHHQFLTKAMNYVLRDSWNPLKEDLSDEAHEVVRRTLAEIMGLAPGYCGGRGGSMHLRYAEAGILGTSAIVGGGIPIATGAAYAEKYRKTGNIVVCFFGDGAVNQGSFHEACNLAGLWKLPIVYVIENNLYAVGTKSDNACSVQDLSLRASAYNMDARIVDGHDVAAVYKTFRDVAQLVRSGSAPFLVEVRCYRHFHHAGDQPGSAYGYRNREEEARMLKRDAVKTFPRALIRDELLSEKDTFSLHDLAAETVSKAVDFCTSGVTSGEERRIVREELWPKPQTAIHGMRSSGAELSDLEYMEREAFEEFEEISYSDTIAAVTGRWMERDERVVEFGEEVANFGGGAYGATKGLPERFPGRIVNTPISEAGFTGLAGGAALSGLLPIVEIMFPDFALVAADQIFNQIGKARYMYGGKTDVPLLARSRVAAGCGYGAQHSMDPVGLFSLFPGWRIVAPSNAFDYIGLFNTAMRSRDPVLIMEHHSLYNQIFSVPKGNLDFHIPFGKARVINEGEDVTLIAYSSLAGRLMNLREELQARGVCAEIIDLRSLDPLSIDYECIGRSVRKTGAVAVIEEAPPSQAIGHRIVSEIIWRFYDWLDGPPGCINSADVPSPVSRTLEKAVILNDERIVQLTEAIAKRRWR
jgi:2-oxoisovalerate dehydrogenase E1 component